MTRNQSRPARLLAAVSKVKTTRPAALAPLLMLAAAFVGCSTSSTSRPAGSQAHWAPFHKQPKAARVPAEPGYSGRGREARDRGAGDPLLPASGTEPAPAKPALPPPRETSSIAPPSAGQAAGTGLALGAARGPSTQHSSISLVSAKEDAALAIFAKFAADPLAVMQPAGGLRPYRYVVVHESGSSRDTLAKLAREHRQRFGYESCGYHFVVGPAGRAVEPVLQPTERWAAQAPGVSLGDEIDARYAGDGIAVCVIGNFEEQAATADQTLACRELLAWLMQRHRVPPYRAMTHTDAAAAYGVDDRFGSLDVGKSADLVLYTGDPFEHATRVTHVLSSGAIVFDRQKSPALGMDRLAVIYAGDIPCCLSW